MGKQICGKAQGVHILECPHVCRHLWHPFSALLLMLLLQRVEKEMRRVQKQLEEVKKENSRKADVLLKLRLKDHRLKYLQSPEPLNP